MQPMHNIPARGGLNYDETPFLAIWEVTQSCDLACKHCRAAAQPIAHPDELTNAEGKALIDQIAEMHVPIFVFTGGDPLKRKDVFELIRYAADKGVQVAVTPSATPLLTREAIFKLKEAGLVRLGISLDGSTPEIHDTFRGLPGAWARTIQAIEWANEAGFRFRCTPPSAAIMRTILTTYARLFEKLAIVMWNVFFLVPVGRGQLGDLLSGEEFEQVFGKIYELSHRVSFQIKTTEAMHYRRYLLQHNLEERRMGHGRTSGQSDDGGSAGVRSRRADQRCADADGQLGHSPGQRRQRVPLRFSCGQCISQRISAHSRRQHHGAAAEEIYRNAPIFKSLRNTSKLEGKCGACEYKEICGGSRARAYAVTGDPLAQEPCCIYQPKNWDPQLESEASAYANAMGRSLQIVS